MRIYTTHFQKCTNFGDRCPHSLATGKRKDFDNGVKFFFMTNKNILFVTGYM